MNDHPNYGFPSVLNKAPPTQITTLNNGFRVITEQRTGETASVGVFIKAGSRNEDANNNGVAHFLEHMYFKGTPTRTAEQLEIEYEYSGAQMNAHTAREYTCFTSHCLQNDIERSVDSLADVLLHSNISKKDVEAERSTILREQEEVNTNLEEVMFDEIHQACYQQSSLGYTILGPKKNIQSLTREQMMEYRRNHYIAPKMILVGVGQVDHGMLTQLAKKYFSDLPVSSEGSLISEPKYIGTEVKIFDKNIPLLYQAIGFEGPSLHSADMLSVNIIQILLGSWDTSSGSGKHIHSDLCSMVAQNGWARSVSSFNHSYSDTGLKNKFFNSLRSFWSSNGWRW
jgi:mitochondrial-processing peptidase subunit beta